MARNAMAQEKRREELARAKWQVWATSETYSDAS